LRGISWNKELSEHELPSTAPEKFLDIFYNYFNLIFILSSLLVFNFHFITYCYLAKTPIFKVSFIYILYIYIYIYINIYIYIHQSPAPAARDST